MRRLALFSLCLCLSTMSIAAFAQTTALPTRRDEARVACPMDAKMCPDGKTYVSRHGAHCEFSPCPGETPPPADGTPKPAPKPITPDSPTDNTQGSTPAQPPHDDNASGGGDPDGDGTDANGSDR